MEVLTTKSTAQINLAMYMDQPPTQDPDLRLALKYALDRETIVDNVLKGLAHVGNDHPISPDRSLLLRGHSAAALRSGEGQIPHQEGGVGRTFRSTSIPPTPCSRERRRRPSSFRSRPRPRASISM